MTPAAASFSRLTTLRYQLAFLSFIRPGSILRFRTSLGNVGAPSLPRALLVITCSLLAQPLRLLEILIYGRRIARVRLAEPPIFIIGHWRSGTTHLHNLLTCDSAFGYVSMYQALAPDICMLGRGWLRPLLGWIVPARRPMDAMAWPMAAPQEEEVALAKTCPYSFYGALLTPRHAVDLFRRRVLLEGVPPAGVAELKREYARILRVATLLSGGRRLVLKNPVNTARIRLLLELYPGAKFVHIHRCPYEVFRSTRKLHRSLTTLIALHDVAADETEGSVISLYRLLMRRLLADRASIPAGSYAEIRYADLERDPVGQLRELYRQLGLATFDQAEPEMRRHLAAQAAYRKDSHSLAPAERERIEREWGFAFDALGYERQGAGPGQSGAASAP